jgi:hypothetical protein
MKRIAFTVAILFLVLLLEALRTVTVQTIRPIDYSAQLMWDSKQALLFIGVGELGRRETLVQLGFELVFNFFGGVFEPANSSHAVVAFRYRNGELEKHVLEGTRINSYTAFDCQIYNAGGDRWTGSRFEKATAEEVERFYANMRGYDTFHPNCGWSEQHGVLTRPELEIHFPMQIGGEGVELIVQRYGQIKSIQLLKADKSVLDVWHLDESLQCVTKEQYERAFGAALVKASGSS